VVAIELLGMNKMFGYFDDDSNTPAYDPGFDMECPFCHKKLSEPMRSPSLMVPGDSRSYFYRVHRECDDRATEEEKQAIDSIIVDAVYRSWESN